MTRADVTARVLEAKRRLGLTWKGIADALGTGSPIFYTAALLGHHTLTPEEADKAGALLKLDPTTARMMTEPPEDRGASLKMPPTDPLIYRFYEIVQGYGPTLKAFLLRGRAELSNGVL
jgi:cyanate lyase